MKIKTVLIIAAVLVVAVYLYSKTPGNMFGRFGQSPKTDRPPGMTGGQPGGGPGS